MKGRQKPPSEQSHVAGHERSRERVETLEFGGDETTYLAVVACRRLDFDSEWLRDWRADLRQECYGGVLGTEVVGDPIADRIRMSDSFRSTNAVERDVKGSCSRCITVHEVSAVNRHGRGGPWLPVD